MAEGKDFGEVVQGYLDKGQIYKPARDFVENLSKCPRFFCQENSPAFLDLILKMADLVKNKLKVVRNKKMYTSWLREAAISLNKLQVAHRDWICQNVWKLPKPKQRPVDPLLEKEEGEESPEEVLDLVAEEGLLRTPTKSTEPMEVDPTTPSKRTDRASESPRRSPKTHEKPKFSPIRAPPKSPERTSTKRDKKVDQHKASSLKAEKPRLKKLAKKHAQTESSDSRHWARASSSSHTELSGGKAVTFQVARASSSASIGKPKPATKASTSSGSSLISSQGVKVTASKLSAFEKGERRVAIGRGMTVEYMQPSVGKGKRPAPKTTLPTLTISTTVTKKPKTDDLIRQAREVKEQRRAEGKRPDRHTNTRCWVPDCTEPNKYIKVHAFKYHVPEIFDERLQPDEERVLRERRNALNQATIWLLGRPVPLEELVSFVRMQRLLASTDNSHISPTQEEAMRALCNFLKLPAPETFLLEPINSPGALLHWKAVLLLSATLDAEEREYWRSRFLVPEDLRIQPEPEEPEEILPEAYDSHFHLDRTLHKLKLESGKLEDIFARVPVEADEKVKLVGTVTVFCDPDSYPTDQSLLDLPEDMTVALGFHPRHAGHSRRSKDESLEHFFRLLKNPRVTALGEVGLDHTEPMKFWAYQVNLLETILPHLQERHVLVIHCRGMKGDCGTEVYMLLLHFLKKHYNPIILSISTASQGTSTYFSDG